MTAVSPRIVIERRRQLVHEALVGVGILHPPRRADRRGPERRRFEAVTDGFDVWELVENIDTLPGASSRAVWQQQLNLLRRT